VIDVAGKRFLSKRTRVSISSFLQVKIYSAGQFFRIRWFHTWKLKKVNFVYLIFRWYISSLLKNQTNIRLKTVSYKIRRIVADVNDNSMKVIKIWFIDNRWKKCWCCIKYSCHSCLLICSITNNTIKHMMWSSLDMYHCSRYGVTSWVHLLIRIYISTLITAMTSFFFFFRSLFVQSKRFF
jgi:hypothetical protein